MAFTVDDLVNMFESAESSTVTARRNSERDRDYVDGIQYTAAELKILADRKQPAITINAIKPQIDTLRGFELNQRVDPRVEPRTPKHDGDSVGAQHALKYVADAQRYDHKRSCVWDNLLVEGAGGFRVAVKQGYRGVDIVLDEIPWDRMFWDPHSRKRDFSDAGYLGVVRWLDYDEAVAEYPDKADLLEWTLTSASASDTYDDKPKFKVWADKTRKRVRICQIWIKVKDKWFWAEFTQGGILVAGESPYVDDKGQSEPELFFASAYVNRENERYGIVRQMISLQDEVNKRRSKSLHYLNTNQTIVEEDATDDIDKLRREAARPDGTIVLNPGGLAKMRIENRLDLSAGHQALMQQARNELDRMGGNLALQGDATQAGASGKAIIASQQGASLEISPLLDALRDLDIRVYRAVWSRIRQFWTAEQWVRVTDDERNVKWAVLNIDPMRLQMIAAQNPELAKKIVGTVENVAELDCDITIDDGPDGVTPQLEQFQAMVELKKMDVKGELPFRAIVMAMPNLRDKERVIAAIDEAKQTGGPPPEQQAAMVLELAGKKAEVDRITADGQLKQAQAAKAMREAMMPPEGQAPPMPGPADRQSPMMDDADVMETMARADDLLAAADLKRAQTDKTIQEIQFAPARFVQQSRAAELRDAGRMNGPPPGR